MLAAEVFDFSFWWICPLVMIALCYFMLKRRRGSMMCGFGSRDTESDLKDSSDSAIEILDKRYARGDINREEYEDIRRTLGQGN
jgi:putative membrane protein